MRAVSRHQSAPKDGKVERGKAAGDEPKRASTKTGHQRTRQGKARYGKAGKARQG
jgi:hypothetical protein